MFRNYCIRKEKFSLIKPKYLNLTDLTKELNLGIKMVKKLVHEGIIKAEVTDKGEYKFTMCEADRLKEIQKKLFGDTLKDNLFEREILEEVDLTKEVLRLWIKENKKENEVVAFPDLCKIKNDEVDYSKVIQVYPKTLANDFMKEKKLLKAQRDIHNTNISNFEKYREIAILNEIKPIENDLELEEIWNKFVKNKLDTTIRTNTVDYIAKLLSSKRALNELMKKNNIDKTTNAEITLFLRSKEITKSTRQTLIEFFNHLNSQLFHRREYGFNTDIIKTKTITETRSLTKEIYDLENYKELVDSLKNEEMLKKLIKEHEYEKVSFFLYLIISTNNAWRDYNITNLKRPDEFLTEKISSKNLVIDDIKMVCEYYRNSFGTHHKNGNERFFTVSEALERNFALCVMYLEHYLGEHHPMYETIINFNNKENSPNKIALNRFISKDLGIRNFRFGIRKMNRTVLSYIYSATSEKMGRDAIEMVQKMRGHSSAETTNIYIKLSQQDINFISDNLFEKGNFGFVYSGLESILSGKTEEFEYTFDLIALNSLPSILENSLRERKKVYEKLKNLEINELQEKKAQLDMGASPSKQLEFQCLIGEENCHYDRDCKMCPYSIMNRLTLSHFLKDLNTKLRSFKDDFDNAKTIGQKTKISNQLYIVLSMLKEMIAFYGRNVVDMYLEGGLDTLNDELKRLPSFKSHLSIMG